MSSAEDIINAVINNALSTAVTATSDAQAAADALTAKQAGFYLNPPDSDSAFTITAVEPEIPKANDSTVVYQVELDRIVAMLGDELDDFFAKYYPLASDAFDEATAWLINQITNGGSGINATLEDALWQRERDRIATEGRRALATISTGFAAKGHFIVPSAMADRQRQAVFEQASNAGVSSTAVAVKQFETEVETVKFAVAKALESRAMAMSAAADYIRAVAAAPAAAARAADLTTDNQARMVQAYSAWYGTRLERDRIVLSSKLAEMASRDDVYKHRRTNATQNDGIEVTALTAAADVLAKTAAAALSSINGIASNSINAFA